LEKRTRMWKKVCRKTAIISSLLIVLSISVAKAQEIKGQEMTSEISDETKGIDVEFKGTDIHTVLRSFAAISGLNIIAGPEVGVPGGVNIKLTQVPWEKAFDVILKTYGLAYERDGNIIRVTTIANLNIESLTTRLFTLNYAKASDVIESLKDMLSERGKIKSDIRTNCLIVTDVSANLNKIENVIKELDIMTLQVAIDSKVIETNLTQDEKLGIRWSDMLQFSAVSATKEHTFPFKNDSKGGDYTAVFDPTDAGVIPGTNMPYADSGNFKFGTLSAGNLNIALNMLQQRSKANVVANPTVTTLNNQTAKIAIVTKWPVAQYQVSSQTGTLTISGYYWQEYGTILEVTPTVNKDGYITLKVHPEVSRQVGTVSFEGRDLPVIGSQETDTNVMLKDGETMVIAGLVKEDIVDTRNKVPILGDIPLIGWVLFRDRHTEVKEKRDLVIFITPHIIRSTPVASGGTDINSPPSGTSESVVGNEEVKVIKKTENPYGRESIDELMEHLEKDSSNNKGYIYKK